MAEPVNGHLTDANDNFVLPPQVLDLMKVNGLHGDEIAPGFRKILKDDPTPDGGMNLVIDHVEGKHQHWQKFVNADGNGYWQNVEGQMQRHRKANPIGVLIGRDTVNPKTGVITKGAVPNTKVVNAKEITS
jgi:hypothetical protein